MRSFIATAALLITAYSLHAEFVGFEIGNGVAVTGGVVQVNFNTDKSHSLSLGPKCDFRVIEVQITTANGKVKRHTMFFAGNHALRAPLPIELSEILGLLFFLGLVCGLVLMLSSRFRLVSSINSETT